MVRKARRHGGPPPAGLAVASTKARSEHWYPALSSIVALVGLAAAGCLGPRKFQPEVDPDTLDETRFVHYLATAPVVTVEEATRAIVILADGQDPYSTYDERMAELQRRDVVRRAWGLQPEDIIDKATLGYMLFKVCKLPGGVNTLLFGSWGLGDRRYAYKEVTAEGILSPGPEYEPVTGGELMAALARADRYMADHGAYATPERTIDSPADLGSDTSSK